MTALAFALLTAAIPVHIYLWIVLRRQRRDWETLRAEYLRLLKQYEAMEACFYGEQPWPISTSNELSKRNTLH